MAPEFGQQSSSAPLKDTPKQTRTLSQNQRGCRANAAVRGAPLRTPLPTPFCCFQAPLCSYCPGASEPRAPAMDRHERPFPAFQAGQCPGPDGVQLP